ncbi:hypothetical protein M7I_0487 [Glarea lozoyensis 74030]|uniref:Uncharacterized protein n=1 Tax=Glarea lozoyensis (strain ATCC 74030 / MF5533) TaxID=1104152 RepID=H0EDN2_GLAL7|nr:hypothetical protein M7I_0487 [Glarea lozoyensis 74030]
MKMQRGIWKGPTKWIPRSELSTEDNVVQEATNGDLHKRKQLDKKQEVPEDSVDGNEHDAEERKLRAALDQYISRRQGASLPASDETFAIPSSWDEKRYEDKDE